MCSPISVGAAALARQAEELEGAGRAGDAKRARALAESFQKELISLIASIRAALARGDEGPEREAPCGGLPARETLRALRVALAGENIGQVDGILAALDGLGLEGEEAALLRAIGESVLVSEMGEAAVLVDKWLERAP
ncbi:MAG: hypothetical protein LBO66_03705 [Deltaproteobacteria bacterium]|nr:hypothetical protein [Deltaproteobacteria bacterium]